MNISPQILRQIEQKLAAQVTGVKAVSGGSVNQAYCIVTKNKKYFIKINSKSKHPGMFEAEAEGLSIMARAGANVPGVILNDNIADESFLLLGWIETGRHTAKASAILGQSLAQMHRWTSDYFGLDHNNYMGSLPQSNTKHRSWSAFFVAERLQPMVNMAVDKELLDVNDMASFEILYKNLPGLFDEEAPALLHGDLWGGNYLVSADETPYLIDPAISYGHREFDLAMTTLFGGFSNEFYDAYQEAFPLAKGWKQRVDLWNLYPLLVHLNLFGMGYLRQVRGCLRQYL
jgi:protein-ribulosamine 3-kinase